MARRPLLLSDVLAARLERGYAPAVADATPMPYVLTLVDGREVATYARRRQFFADLEGSPVPIGPDVAHALAEMRDGVPFGAECPCSRLGRELLAATIDAPSSL